MRWSRPEVFGLALLLAACAGGGKPRPQQPARPPAAASTGAVKIGKPYQVFGVWYYPADEQNYDQTGIASWYGPGFHAMDTANGERYDQDGVTAAHKTLPMPSWVEVHNLDNGRRLTVRINDRGPFVAGRIIDLSRRAAQLLGVDGPGTARVRVRRVAAPAMAAAAAPPPQPQAPPMVDSVPVVVAAPVPSANPSPPPVAGYFVQVAALADPGRIAWLKGYLGVFGPVALQPAPGGLTRVRLGPYADATAAQAALTQLRAAGYGDARLVVPQ
ncbi:MAG: septal ring lytic transglycosylase RlpA family protein [Sphingomonadales bacterium]